MSKPSGFRSKGHGDDRKVYPVFGATKNVGRPLRSSRYIDRSRQQLYEQRMERMDKARMSKANIKEGVWCGHEHEIKAEHCGRCRGKEDYHTNHEPRLYTVTMRYADGEHETIKQIAHSPEESIHLAQLHSSARHRQERPVEVTSKNGLGDIVGKALAWGVGGVKKTLKTYKTTRKVSTLRERAKKGDVVAIKELRRMKTEQDIEKGQSEALKREGLL